MSVLQVANLHFNTGGSTRIEQPSANTIQLTVGSTNTMYVTSNTITYNQPVNVSVLGVTSNLYIGGSLVLTGNVVTSSGLSIFNTPEVSVTANTYTITVTDPGKMVTFANTGNTIVTVPNNTIAPIANNERIDVMATTNGIVSFANGVGVTLRSYGSKNKLTGQWSVGSLWKKGTNEWVLIGDIKA
jgi:hypothetical protein